MNSHAEEPYPIEDIDGWSQIVTPTTNIIAMPDADTTTPHFVVTTPNDSIIQLFRRQGRNHNIPSEQVSDWITVSNTLMQQEIARLFINLYVVTFLAGLVDFVLTQTIWLLAACALPLLIRWIIGFYFKPSKK